MRSFLCALLFLGCAHQSPTPVKNVSPQLASEVIHFDGPVDDATVTLFEMQLELENANGADRVIVEINSPGGSVFAGMRMAKAIENSKDHAFSSDGP